jgi:hypothetical protein
VALLPSIVHLVFVLVLAANLATFCLGSRQRIPIAANQVVALPSGERLRVAELNLVNYPDASLLAGRVMNGRVQLQSLDRPRQSPAIVRFMRPLYRAGRFLHLDVEQRPDPLTGEKAATMVCNRAEVKNVAHFHAQAYLMITRDPGLFPILAGFAVIVLLMACYYVTGLSRREPV